MEIFRIVLIIVLLAIIASKLLIIFNNRKKSLDLKPTIKKQVYEEIELNSRKNNEYNIVKHFNTSKESEHSDELIIFKGLSLVEDKPTTKAAHTSDSHWSSSDSSSSDSSSNSD